MSLYLLSDCSLWSRNIFLAGLQLLRLHQSEHLHLLYEQVGPEHLLLHQGDLEHILLPHSGLEHVSLALYQLSQPGWFVVLQGQPVFYSDPDPMLSWWNLDCDSFTIVVRARPEAQVKALKAVPNSLIGKLPENYPKGHRRKTSKNQPPKPNNGH